MQTKLSSIIFCTKVSLDGYSIGIGSIRFSIMMYEEELVTKFFYLWTMLQGNLNHFKGRMLWCNFYFQCNKSWKQVCNLAVISAVKKIYKFFLLKYVLSLYQVDNDNQQLLKKKVLNFVYDMLMFAMTDLQLC